MQHVDAWVDVIDGGVLAEWLEARSSPREPQAGGCSTCERQLAIHGGPAVLCA